jgi:hypothetical protein
MQLSVNFRSHNAILQLSNIVVSVIEVLFPSSIDRLQREKSGFDGPRPILLTGDSLNDLNYFMENELERGCSDELPERSQLEFGRYKTILVRNQ